jgi:hypothetical protein
MLVRGWLQGPLPAECCPCCCYLPLQCSREWASQTSRCVTTSEPLPCKIQVWLHGGRPGTAESLFPSQASLTSWNQLPWGLFLPLGWLPSQEHLDSSMVRPPLVPRLSWIWGWTWLRFKYKLLLPWCPPRVETKQKPSRPDALSYMVAIPGQFKLYFKID